MYEYTGKVINIVDGDTIDVTVDLGFKIQFSQRIRLNGIDAPELTEKEEEVRNIAKKAKQRLNVLILGVDVRLVTYKPDKYGRYLADIYLGDLFINEILVKEYLAIPYAGGKR